MSLNWLDDESFDLWLEDLQKEMIGTEYETYDTDVVSDRFAKLFAYLHSRIKELEDRK